MIAPLPRTGKYEVEKRRNLDEIAPWENTQYVLQ